MPTYTYRCEDCGHQFEVVQRMTEDALKDCPDCQATSLVKQIQPVGFALKGTGWYVTDFRDKGKATKKPETEGQTKVEAKTDTTPETKGDAKVETKTETKSETKPETTTATPSTST